MSTSSSSTSPLSNQFLFNHLDFHFPRSRISTLALVPFQWKPHYARLIQRASSKCYWHPNFTLKAVCALMVISRPSTFPFQLKISTIFCCRFRSPIGIQLHIISTCYAPMHLRINACCWPSWLLRCPLEIGLSSTSFLLPLQLYRVNAFYCWFHSLIFTQPCHRHPGCRPTHQR